MALPNIGMNFTPYDTLTAAELDDIVENIEALADGSGQNTASITGAKIATSTITQTNLAEKLPEYTFDFIASGCVWSGDAYGSTRNASCSSGVVYLNGVRLTVAAVVARTFTASKDVYCDLSDNGDGTAVWNYTDNTTNAASPALTAGRLRGAIIVVGAANIANVGSVNMGEESKVLPIASSIPYAVTDSLGNLICPRDPNRKILGYRQILADQGSITSVTDIVGLSVPVIVPASRKIKITIFSRGTNTTADSYNFVYIFEGASQLNVASANSRSGTAAEVYDTFWLGSPTAGLHTFKGAADNGGSGTFTVRASSTNPAFIMVELV